jgi:GNAT superfamily N-acetyltransferase
MFNNNFFVPILFGLRKKTAFSQISVRFFSTHAQAVPFVASPLLQPPPRAPDVGAIIPHLQIPSTRIRNMTTKEFNSIALEWTKREKWNPGKYDASVFELLDPNSLHLLEVNKVPVASLIGMRHNSNFGFLGSFIVRADYRGLGYGRLLWEHVLKGLKCSTIGLHGVFSQVGYYQKEGFIGQFSQTRWVNNSKPSLIPASSFEQHNLITSQVPINKLIDYDAGVVSILRPNLVSNWLKMPEAHVLVALDGQDKIAGYGVISRTQTGYRIGPLYADSENIAKTLFLKLSDHAGNMPIIFDTYEKNEQVNELIDTFGLQKEFSTLVMYKGSPPRPNYERLYGVHSLEIG